MRKSLRSFIVLNRNLLLCLGIVLGIAIFGIITFRTAAQSSVRQRTDAPADRTGDSVLAPAPASWVTVAPMPQDLYGVSMTSNGTYAYAAGGHSFSASATVNSFRRYDPFANSWTTLANMPAVAGMASAVYSPVNNKVYLFGGEDFGSGVVSNATRIYDVGSNTWSSGANMPGPRNFMASGYYNGKIYLVSGYSTGNVTDVQPNTWEYDPIANTWNTARANLPHAAGGMAFGIINGHMYVAGGRDATTVISLVWDYDIAGNTWTARANMPSATNVPGSAAQGGKLFVFGSGNPFRPSESKESLNASIAPDTAATGTVYDPSTNTWSSAPNLSGPRSFVGGTTIGTRLIAAGGYDGATTVATTELLDNSTACGKLIGSTFTTGFGPSNYTALAANTVNYTFSTSLAAAPNQFAIFQTHDPWGVTIIKNAITATGHTYTVFTPAQLSGFNFSNYRVVILNWDDTSEADFDPAYSLAITALETYVGNGGVVWVQGALQPGGTNSYLMPFGGTASFNTSASDVIVDNTDPMVTGILSPITGNLASHATYSGLPGAAHIVARMTNNAGPPVLYDLGVPLCGAGHGLEADVAPRPGGDGNLLSNDVTVIRQLVVGTAIADPTTNEFQRADSAPRATSGDGLLTSADTIQTRRYVAGLDAPQPAAGPLLLPVYNRDRTDNAGPPDEQKPRSVRVVSTNALAGDRVSVAIEIAGSGDELATSFTLEFDPNLLSNPRVVLGSKELAGAVLTINDRLASDGKIGILIDSSEPIASGTRLLTIMFDVSPGAVPGAVTPLIFTDGLAMRSLSDGEGDLLNTKYENGAITIGRRSPVIGNSKRRSH